MLNFNVELNKKIVDLINEEPIEMVMDRYNVGGRTLLINDGKVVGFLYEDKANE